MRRLCLCSVGRVLCFSVASCVGLGAALKRHGSSVTSVTVISSPTLKKRSFDLHWSGCGAPGAQVRHHWAGWAGKTGHGTQRDTGGTCPGTSRWGHKTGTPGHCGPCPDGPDGDVMPGHGPCPVVPGAVDLKGALKNRWVFMPYQS